MNYYIIGNEEKVFFLLFRETNSSGCRRSVSLTALKLARDAGVENGVCYGRRYCLPVASQFESRNQMWEEYCEILQHFFVVKKITDAGQQKGILHSSAGSQT